ncbi:MAG: hypothetical protein AMXMBFR53_37870 [Gemmatimonadota bacterium]
MSACPRRRRWGALVPLVAAACALPAGTPGTEGPGPLPPPGYGTLRQDEITVDLTSGRLQIKVTPLAEAVTRVTAPDTYRRLSGLASRFGPDAVRGTGADDPALFLVSFFSETPDVAFVPEEIQLIARGVRLRPGAILPVTPGWGQRRVAQRETEMAVYAFGSGVDLESDLVVAYGLVESGAWSGILPRVQAERARARARAGVEGG